jgi:hypothetical protein
MMRAWQVFVHLRKSARLPPEIFSLKSYGARRTPFPNDSPANRARNETVVIRIGPRPSERWRSPLRRAAPGRT